MKYCIIIFSAILLSSCTQTPLHNTLVELNNTTGISRDEIFIFKVTYSNISLNKDSLKFTQTFRHKETDGTLKATINWTLPKSGLKKAKHGIDKSKGIGKNIIVWITPNNSQSIYGIELKHELRGKDGKLIKPIKSSSRKANQCEIYFSNVKDAEHWNKSLGELINSI